MIIGPSSDGFYFLKHKQTTIKLTRNQLVCIAEEAKRLLAKKPRIEDVPGQIELFK